MDLHIPVFDPRERKQVRSRCRSRTRVVIEERPYIFHWFGCIGLAVYLHHVIEYHSTGSLVNSVPRDVISHS